MQRPLALAAVTAAVLGAGAASAPAAELAKAGAPPAAGPPRVVAGAGGPTPGLYAGKTSQRADVAARVARNRRSLALAIETLAPCLKNPNRAAGFTVFPSPFASGTTMRRLRIRGTRFVAAGTVGPYPMG